MAFGSGNSAALAAIGNIDREVKNTFPGAGVFWAFTSSVIRNKLRNEGRPVDSPEEALEKMKDFEIIAVQSFHVIPGGEFDSLKRTIRTFEQRYGKPVKLGRPLLYHHKDIVEVCRLLPELFPLNLHMDDAVVLMGHGTSHPANIYYPGMQYYLNQLKTNCRIATVEGYPALSDILPDLKQQQIKRVWLMPFLAVTGKHALNDMAGDGASSWKSVLEREGYAVNSIAKGLAEYTPMVRLWISHLEDAFNESVDHDD